jgi:alpha-beta hydrolase superfamily lysophospholipase
MDQTKWRRLLIGEFSWLRLLKSLALVYLVFGVAVYFFADRLMFHPETSPPWTTEFPIKVRTADGVILPAMHLPNSQAAYTVLFSHGNAEDIRDVAPQLNEIREAGFAVFAYDYRGYGTGNGVPTEDNAYQDIDAAYSYLTGTLGVAPGRIIAYGRSLGGGPSVDLASRKPLAGLIVESTFVTAFRVRTHIAILPFDKFRNIDKIADVRAPVLVMHGVDDEIIPLWHGRALFERAREPKLALWVEHAGHNDVPLVAGTSYAGTLRKFAALLAQ